MKVAADAVLASFKEISLDQIQALEIPFSSIDGETTANQRNEFLTLDRIIFFLEPIQVLKHAGEFATQKLFHADVRAAHPPHSCLHFLVTKMVVLWRQSIKHWKHGQAEHLMAVGEVGR